MNSDELNTSLTPRFRRRNASAGRESSARATTAEAGDKKTSANASGTSDSEKAMPSRWNSTLKTLYSKTPNNTATTTNTHTPAERVGSPRPPRVDPRVTVTASNTADTSATCVSGRRIDVRKPAFATDS